MTRALRAWALVSAAALAACDAGAATDGTVVRDSAGVRVVAHLPGPRDTVRVSNPLLTIGAEGNTLYEFASVRFVGGLSDGRIVVVDRGSWQLRFYSPEGAHVAALGSQGDGPGQFRGMDQVQLLPGDTLRVHDVRLARVSSFSPEPAFVGSRSYAARMQSIPRAAGQGVCVPPQLRGSLPDQTLVFIGWTCWEGTGVEGIRDVPTDVFLIPPDSAPPQSLGSFRVSSVYERTGVPVQNQFTGLSMFGTLVVRPSDDRVLLAHPESHAVYVYGSDGKMSLVIQDELPRRAVDDAVRARREAEIAAAPPVVREFLSGLPYPDSIPAFDQLLDGDGQIWARHDPNGGDGTGVFWSVYTRSGERLGTVAFPASFTLHSIVGGRAFGVRRDELDVERVQVFAVPLS